MNAGDLVKRNESEWTKHNICLTFDEANEVGIILRLEERKAPSGRGAWIVVMWSSGLDWCDSDDLEVISESR